jgi:hypothetical protein
MKKKRKKKLYQQSSPPLGSLLSSDLTNPHPSQNHTNRRLLINKALPNPFPFPCSSSASLPQPPAPPPPRPVLRVSNHAPASSSPSPWLFLCAPALPRGGLGLGVVGPVPRSRAHSSASICPRAPDRLVVRRCPDRRAHQFVSRFHSVIRGWIDGFCGSGSVRCGSAPGGKLGSEQSVGVPVACRSERL